MAPGTERASRRGRRILAVDTVPDALCARWIEGDPLELGGPLPGQEHRGDLRLLATEIGPLVLKRFVARGERALRARLWRGRGKRAYLVGRALHAAGVPVPEPLAWIRDEAGEHGEVLVQRYVEGAPPWRHPTLARDRGELLDALARALVALHTAGFRHRDLGAPNWIVAGPAEEPRAWILDLDGAARAAAPPRRATVVRDLGRLSASFLSDPARAAGLDERDWHALVQRYAARTGRRAEARWLSERTLSWARAKVVRDHARGRPLA